MKIQKNFVSYVTRTLVVAVAVTAMPSVVSPLLGSEAFSVQAEEKRRVPKRKKRKSETINAKLFKKFDAAQQAAEANNFAEAMEILGDIKARGDKLNGYEKVQLNNFYAFIYFSQEKYDEAIKSYEAVAKSESTPWGLVDSTNYSLSQLYFIREDYKQAISYLNEWFKYQETPGASAYVFRGQMHYQMENKDASLKDVVKGIEIQDKKKLQPKEQWLQLASVLYYEKKDMPNAMKYLTRLVALYPKKQYLMQLSGMYGGQGKDLDQLALLNAAYSQGYLDKEKESLNLAYLYLNNDVPYKAAKIIEKGISQGVIEKTSKNWETLGNAWYRSKDTKKSIPALEKAASKAETGEIYYRLSSAYLDQEDYANAVKAGEAAVAKGGLKDPSLTKVVLGSAYFYNRQLNDAEKIFKELKVAGDKENAKFQKNKDGVVVKDKKVIRAGKYAKDWLRMVSNEKKQKAKMAELGINVDSITYKPKRR